MYYKDDFYKEFRTEKELCEYLEEIDSRAEWIRITSKKLKVAAAGEETCTEVPGISLEALEKDTLSHSRLVLILPERICYIGNSAIKSLKGRARIDGKALADVDKKTLAEILNKCLKVARGRALIRFCEGKIRAVLSGDEKDYAIISMPDMYMVTNGKDVARLLVDEYLNCHPTGHKKFMESMAKEQQEIKDNYTYLGFAWLKGLSEVRYYDLRNEASKLMADDLCLHVKEQPERVRLVYEGAEEMEINPSDEEQMAKMFTCYLLAGSMDGYGEFVDYALDTHRTLQQNLTRFFVEWFAKAEKGSAFLKRAKMVYSRYSLPYI